MSRLVFYTLHQISRLETLLATVSQQLSDLKTDVFSNARKTEEAKKAPIPVLKIKAEDVTKASFAQYNLAHEDCGKVWSLATLETGNGLIQLRDTYPRWQS